LNRATPAACYDRPVASLARYCRFVLAYNLAVILWGAYVRATGSGAGCGSHWPSCNGEAVPLGRSAATWIEYSHRVSSGLVLLFAAVLAIWAFRAAPKGHPVRRGAILAVAFTLSEAAVGAGLVLFKLVAHDESLAHALAIGAHLLNTLLLLAALAMVTHSAGGAGGADGAGGAPRSRWRHLPAGLRWRLSAGLAGTMALAATGAVAALGDTLFPAASLRQGLAQDLSPASHLLLRLRTVHPLLAVAVGIYLLWLCNEAVAAAAPAARPWAGRLRFLVLAQAAVGVLNIGLLAPLWLQLSHLLLADLLWIALVLLALDLVRAAPAPAALPPRLPAPAHAAPDPI
jgi:cytochrome c oxidase assembly protein subunit 15